MKVESAPTSVPLVQEWRIRVSHSRRHLLVQELHRQIGPCNYLYPVCYLCNAFKCSVVMCPHAKAMNSNVPVTPRQRYLGLLHIRDTRGIDDGRLSNHFQSRHRVMEFRDQI